MDITNPSVNASLSDSSRNDDSFTQSGTTVNIGQGATYNQNCGNGKELTRRRSMWTLIGVSVLCDVFIISMLFYLNWKNTDRTAAVERATTIVERALSDDLQKMIDESNQVHNEIMKQAKDGTIWLLRDDILKTIDFYEATLKITEKQYKRIKDEYDYYISIGGNHDVKDRFDSFFIKIYGTKEIKMVSDDAVKPH